MKFFAETDAAGLVISIFAGNVEGHRLVEISKENYETVRGGGVFHLADGVLTLQPATSSSLQDRKQVKWNEIRLERDRRQLDGGVKVDGHWLLSTERATSEYNTIINTTRSAPDTTIVRAGWRTMNGAEIDMTPALALKILTLGIAQRCSIDDAAQAHKSAMEICADPSAYDFSGGWPKVFGEE